MSDLVQLTTDNGIAIITINNPPVNALSPGVPEGIAESIEKINQDASIQAAVVIGGGRTFIAGADIKEFGKITSGKNAGTLDLPTILLRIEDSRKPVVMAIHGTAFGGGLEVAMAGHYRVASPGAQVGQPEVKLGIIPGAAGTQRLPRLAGIAAAVEMCAGGNPIKTEEAAKLGIVDRLIEGDLLKGAVAFAREIAGKPAPRTRDRNEKLGTPEQNAAIFAAARDAARKKQRGMMAPLAAIEAVEAATKQSFDEGCKTERKLFMDCLFSDQSKAMIHVFFGDREVAKIPDIPKETQLIPVKRGRFTQQFVDERLKLITPTLTYDGFENADMVTEAAFEGMALKKQIFGELDRVCKPGAILASNTSTLSIDEIASSTSRPQNVIGTHYFSPANVMRLLEVVRGKATSKEVIATCMALSKKLGKVGVLVGNCRGFVGNRMFHPYVRESVFLVEEGASVEAVDSALYDFGMAMGPLAVGDLAGLDVGWRIRKEYRHTEKPGIRVAIAGDNLCEMGRYGQKTGAGWYKYDENRRAVSDPEVAALVKKWATEAGIKQRQISPEEIVDRCVYALVNEGARILEEGYALRAVDIDIIYINGYGFPVYRGGPMWYADTVGLKKVCDRIEEFHKQHGELWEPAPLLKRLAAEGKKFSDFNKEQTAAA